MIPFTGIGAAGGFGLSEMAGGALDALDAPRRLIWNKVLGVDKGTELMGQMGMDPENPLVQALGLGAEMLLDPLNLVGAGLGAKAGRLAGHAADVAGTRRALGAERAGIEEAMGLARQGVDDLATRAAPTNVPVSHADVSYHPAIMDELGKGSLAEGRVYNRVNPAMAKQIDEMGIGYRMPQGGMMLPHGKPSFMQGRGGVLQQSMPMPWRSGFDPMMVDRMGNSVRVPDQMNELIQATLPRQGVMPGVPNLGSLTPRPLPQGYAELPLGQVLQRGTQDLDKLGQTQQALGAPGILERILTGMRLT